MVMVKIYGNGTYIGNCPFDSHFEAFLRKLWAHKWKKNLATLVQTTNFIALFICILYLKILWNQLHGQYWQSNFSILELKERLFFINDAFKIILTFKEIMDKAKQFDKTLKIPELRWQDFGYFWPPPSSMLTGVDIWIPPVYVDKNIYNQKFGINIMEEIIFLIKYRTRSSRFT